MVASAAFILAAKSFLYRISKSSERHAKFNCEKCTQEAGQLGRRVCVSPLLASSLPPSPVLFKGLVPGLVPQGKNPPSGTQKLSVTPACLKLIVFQHTCKLPTTLHKISIHKGFCLNLLAICSHADQAFAWLQHEREV